MAADRDAGVDPRFDPVFQRGYDPDKHGARATPRDAPACDRADPGHADPRAGRGCRHGETRRRPVTSPRPLAVAAPAVRDPDLDLTLRGRNPFRLALLVASIAAIGGAGLLIWNRIEENPGYQGFSGTDLPRLFRSQLTDAALVPLLTAGLLGLCLWLAIGALGAAATAAMSDRRPIGWILGLIVIAIVATTTAVVLTWIASDLQIQVNQVLRGPAGGAVR